MKHFAVLIIFLSTVCLSACVTSPQLPSYDTLLTQQTKQNGRTCIHENDIRGFGILANDVISVDSRSRNEYFLVTTLFRCNTISTTPQLGFVGSFGQFCAGPNSKIVSVDETCPIKSIYKFASRKAAFEVFEMAKTERNKIRDEFELAQAKEVTK